MVDDFVLGGYICEIVEWFIEFFGYVDRYFCFFKRVNGFFVFVEWDVVIWEIGV